MKPCSYPVGHLLNPAFRYTLASAQTVEHLREVFQRERERQEREKMNEQERAEKVRMLNGKR